VVSVTDEAEESPNEIENTTPERHATPNRGLPTWAIDTLMFGMPPLTPATRIWGKAVSIAMCAQARGWTQMEFINEFMSRTMRKNKAGQKRFANHKLWEQIQAYSKHGNSGLRELDKAWAAGKVNRLKGEGLVTPEELVNNAIGAAWAWEDRITEGKDGLSDNEAMVIAYVIAFIEKREMVRVTCPVREVGDFAGIPKSTAARLLKSLTERGFLVQFSRGFRSKDESRRKAAIYQLSDPYSLRYGGRGAVSEKPYVHRNRYV
jgi:DNA-binding MarR family transcriptional regulator